MNVSSAVAASVLLACLAGPAFAQFKTFEELDKGRPPAAQRLAAIRAFFAPYKPFADLDEVEQRAAWAEASMHVVKAACGEKSPDGKAMRYPAWAQSALISDVGGRYDTTTYTLPKAAFAWAIIGKVLDDGHPCEIAEVMTRSDSTR